MASTEQALADFDWARVLDYAKRVPVDPPKTQYELPGVTQETHHGVPVAVVPLWHAVVTAKFAFPKGELGEAKRRLGDALAEVESIYPLGPTGILSQVAYGLNYFQNYLPRRLTDQHMPRSTRAGSEGEWALIDAIRFVKDPEDLVLEQNDISFHFKCDYKEHIDEVLQALFFPEGKSLNGIPVKSTYVGDLFSITTIRRGFAGHDMPRTLGTRLGIPGAEKIPAGAMLFMGFTSSHIHGLAAGNLPSFETIPGWTDQTRDSYFAGGTAMHLSHIAIDLDKWFDLPHQGRLHRMFNPRRTEAQGVLSPDQAPKTATFKAERDRDVEAHKLVGHNEQMQFLSRVEEDTVTPYGDRLEKGTVFFLRQDFDTVENPFEFSTEGPVDSRPRAGVHFIGFGPSAQHFELMRREMDSVDLQRQYQLSDENVGFTKFLHTTHRQNYLLPPRAHRCFPLAGLD
ncbi:MAG: DUF7405 family protein [Candidatus Dormibacteria bacterium]